MLDTFIDACFTKNKTEQSLPGSKLKEHIGNFGEPVTFLSVVNAAQLRQPIENSLVLCHLKTLRLYTGLFKYELEHYLTNVARVKSTYWG